MKDLYINLQPRTKIQQATNSTSDIYKNDNSKTTQEENKLTVFGLSENQAAHESISSDFVDRYRNDKLRVDAESLGISIAIQTRRFRLGKYSSNYPKERSLVLKIANHWNFCVFDVEQQIEREYICQYFFVRRRMVDE